MGYSIHYTFRASKEQIDRLKSVAKHRQTTGTAVLRNYIESEYKKISDPQLA